MILLDGKNTSSKIKESLKEEVFNLKNKYGRSPKLAIVLVGDVDASHIYVKNKIKACKYVGIDSLLICKEESITTEELLLIVKSLNEDDSIDGIIVQLPLPKHINEQVIINCIDKNKDVDGFGIENKGKLFSGIECFKSATPFGIVKLYHL